MSRSIFVVVAIALWAAAGCSAVVGASCAEGLTLCEGRCVDLSAEASHCGRCGAACPTGVACIGGFCGGDGGMDAGPDGATDVPFDSDTPELDAGDVPGLDVPELDTPELDAPELDAPGRDVPDLDADLDAGDAEALDAGPADVPDAPPCLPGETFCAGICTDVLSDPEHCGRCGNFCPSGLCAVGACVGRPAGHVVVIGHDYETGRAAMRRLVGNAVFLARTAPVNVLVYVGDATIASRTGTDAAIDATAADVGRTWVRTAASSPADVPTMLAGVDVFLLYAQRGATDAALDALAASWRDALSAFVDAGGIVVVLDTASPTNSGTHRVLAPTGLFPITALTDVSRTTMTLVRAGDAIALGVPLTYRGERTTVRFDASLPGTVVEDATGAPVVLHTTTGP